MFSFLYPIGKGGFGKVWKVQQKKSKQDYAMKEMLKARIISKRSVNSVMNERYLLSIIKHPFIVNMEFAFQSRENLYLVMDLMPGGDLRYHLGRQRKFTEVQTKFFVACMFCALEYIHLHKIIHRDIKPENLVLDKRGYVRLTDFGIARFWQEDNNSETSGTPGYMSPEVICRQNHTIAADYFALGVIVFEFMLGRRPYNGKTRKDIRDAILAKQVQLKKTDMPEGWSLEALDFTNKLLQRKPQNRLGFGGPAEVKSHAWLRDVDWVGILQKTINPPFLPKPMDNFDSAQVNNDWRDEVESVNLNDQMVQKMFDGYFYDSTMNNSKTEPISKIEKSVINQNTN
jgi:serine/threonine protein kinase